VYVYSLSRAERSAVLQTVGVASREEVCMSPWASAEKKILDGT